MDPSGANNSVFLVDAHSLIFQVFHAIRGISSPSGLPTNALFGFVRDMLYLREQKPGYSLCAFDRAEPTFRSDLYPDYKAHREPAPDDLLLQIPLIEQALDAMNVPVVSHPRYEADDILATIATAAAGDGKEVWVYTNDKDCRQLINDHIRLFNLRKRQSFGRAELLEDWGIKPEQVVDLQSLVGDSVDNVPGVAGIGVKTAAKLLQDYGTLENILASVDQIAGAKRQENLRAAGPVVALSRQLVRLAIDVPIQLDWEAWRLTPMDVPRLLALFREWGFHSFASQVRQMQPTKPSKTSNGPVQRELFPFGANAGIEEALDADAPAEDEQPANALPADSASARRDEWHATYHLVDTMEIFSEFLQLLKQQPRFAVDTETTGLQPLTAQIVGLAFSWKAGEAWYLALRGPEGASVLDAPTVLESLRPIFADPKVAKVNQNIKYDLLVLRAAGIEVAGVAGDSMVADYLLHAGERTHGLEDLSLRYLNHQVIPITDLIGKGSRKQPQLRMDQVAPERVAEYSGEDADAVWRLCERLEPELEQASRVNGSLPGTAGLRHLYDDLEVPLIEVLADLEFNGIRIDVPLLRRISEAMSGQLAAIEAEIYALAGRTFNIGSLPQLRTILFDELKLPAQRRTGLTGAASTNQETLEKLAALDHVGAALPRKVLEHRQIAKLKGTYVDALPELVNPVTGRVHTSFNQTTAATGRLSSSDPNLQNIPVRREQGQQIRQAFIPQESWTLITADYSQVELRLLAHFCGDAALRRAFAEDRDVHAAVAAQIYGVDENLVSSEMRRAAKTVNFGVIYGISPHGLAQRLGIPRDEAARFIAAYFGRYPLVEEYQQKLLQECQRTGFVTTILGRRRHIQGVRANSRYQNRNQPEREAINMQVQGSAADLIKLAMLNLHRRLRREKRQARMLLQIHDELVFEAPPAEATVVATLVREEMTRALPLEVPLVVDLASGPNWLDVQ